MSWTKNNLKKKVSEIFLTGEEIDIKKKHFNIIDELNLFQESYFLYDRSNVIKITFISEISKSFSHLLFWKFLGGNWKRKNRFNNGKKLEIIFYIKKCRQKELDLQIVKLSWKKTETTDNKIHNVFFQGLEKKERQKWIQ